MLRVLLTGAVLASLAQSARAEDVVLKFWDNQQTESGLSQYQKEAVKRFEQENPGIRVEVTTVPYPEYQQRLLTPVQGGNAPEVPTLDQICIAAFAKAGAIAALDDRATAAGIKADTFFKGAWDSANYDGKLWGIPFNVDVWSFTFFNDALLKGASLDPATLTSWDGFKAASQKLTDTSKGKYGVGLFAGKGEDTVVVLDSFIFSNGGKILNADGSCALTSPEAVDALKYVQTLVPYAPQGMNNANSGNMRELFLNQSVAMDFWPALEQPTLQKYKLDWDFASGIAPAGKTPVGTYGGWNLAVYQSSAHQDAAWKFVQFMTREDVNGAVVDLIPANIRAAKAFLAANRKGPDRVMELLDHAAPRPLSPRYLEVSDIEVTLAQDVYGGKDAGEAAKDACSKIDALR